MKAFVQRSVFVLLALLAARGDGLRGQWKIVAPSVFSSVSNDGGAICYFGGILRAGTSSLWSSNDMGRTWIQQFNAPQDTYFDISFLDSLDGAIATAGGVYITNDGGKSWRLALSTGSSDFLKVSFFRSPSTLGALSCTDGFYLSQDGGANWQKTLLFPDRAFSFAVAPDGTLYLLSGDWSTQTGSVQVSTDDGQTWTDQMTPVDFDAWTLSVDSCDSKRLYLADEQYYGSLSDHSSNVLLSTDGGASWQNVQSHPSWFFSGSLSNSSRAIYAGTVEATSQGVLRSTDQGTNWKSIGGPSVLQDSRNIIAIDNNTVFAVDYMGNVWVTYNAGGDSVLSSSGNGPITITPRSLFEADTVICDSVTRSLTITSPGCNTASVTSSWLTGADSAAFDEGTQIGTLIPVTFHATHLGDFHAELIFQISDGTFDTIALGGYAAGAQLLKYNTSDETTDTLGNTVAVPITITGFTHPENVNLILHYDSILQYQGSFDAANVKLDIPGQQWPGRSKLNIANAQGGVIACYARFTVFADSGAKPQVTFDSLDVLSASSPCEYTLPSAVTSTITPPSGCGTTILSEFLKSGQVPTLTIRPNPTMGDVELTSFLDIGNAEVEVCDMLGIRLGDITITLGKDAPVSIPMPGSAGIYYLRIKSEAGISSMSVIVAK